MGRTKKQIKHLNEARHQKKEKVHVTKYCTYKTNVCIIHCVYVYIYVLGLSKRFECSNLCSFAAHLKLNFSLRSLAATPTLIFCICALV